MDEMLSQEEINALLGGVSASENGSDKGSIISESEKDAIGEISNISMGTAATTLFSLVNQRVTITTPKVTACNWDDLVQEYDRPCVFVQIFYKEGLDGNNILILKEKDAKVITDLMMGGDGTNIDGEFSELHLSAISEAMNQMIGSAATSMSSMLEQKIDILPPISNLIDMNDNIDESGISDFLSEQFIRVAFRMEIGDLVDSEIMQLYPIDFAKSLYEKFMHAQKNEDKKQEVEEQKVENEKATNEMVSQALEEPSRERTIASSMETSYKAPQRDINVQAAQFQNFDMEDILQQKENIDLIMDVPLEVTVELGKTHKSIKEILEFTPGTILELDRLAGEPIDVLVNGKLVAKGEVVVIDENFGIRVTDIIKK